MNHHHPIFYNPQPEIPPVFNHYSQILHSNNCFSVTSTTLLSTMRFVSNANKSSPAQVSHFTVSENTQAHFFNPLFTAKKINLRQSVNDLELHTLYNK